MPTTADLASRPRRRWTSICQGLVVGLATSTALSTAALHAADFVVVSAAAIPAYRRGPSGVQPESYVFSPGRYFAGHTRDRAQEGTSFRSIAQSLAPALAKQSYFPAKDPAKADLLIIVHWGTTQPYENPNREFAIEQMNAALSAYREAAGESGDADPGALNALGLGQAADGSLQEQSMARSAELLGYKRSLRTRSQRLYASEAERTMREELAEERLFVVLMAYDYRVFKNEKRRHLLWTTHINIRSAGTNFAVALPHLANAAATFFGRNVDDPVHITPHLRRGQVNVGEPRVVPSSSPSEQTRPPGSAAPQPGEAGTKREGS